MKRTIKWRPVSTSSMESGFVDENVYFKQDKTEVMRTAHLDYIAKKIDGKRLIHKQSFFLLGSVYVYG